MPPYTKKAVRKDGFFHARGALSFGCHGLKSRALTGKGRAGIPARKGLSVADATFNRSRATVAGAMGRWGFDSRLSARPAKSAASRKRARGERDTDRSNLRRHPIHGTAFQAVAPESQSVSVNTATRLVADVNVTLSAVDTRSAEAEKVPRKDWLILKRDTGRRGGIRVVYIQSLCGN